MWQLAKLISVWDVWKDEMQWPEKLWKHTRLTSQKDVCLPQTSFANLCVLLGQLNDLLNVSVLAPSQRLLSKATAFPFYRTARSTLSTAMRWAQNSRRHWKDASLRRKPSWRQVPVIVEESFFSTHPNRSARIPGESTRCSSGEMLGRAN